jgi:hypothetical protein
VNVVTLEERSIPSVTQSEAKLEPLIARNSGNFYMYSCLCISLSLLEKSIFRNCKSRYTYAQYTLYRAIDAPGRCSNQVTKSPTDGLRSRCSPQQQIAWQDSEVCSRVGYGLNLICRKTNVAVSYQFTSTYYLIMFICSYQSQSDASLINRRKSRFKTTASSLIGAEIHSGAELDIRWEIDLAYSD